MIPRQGERLVIGEEHGTIACMEGAKFQTLQGCCEDSEKHWKRYRQIRF